MGNVVSSRMDRDSTRQETAGHPVRNELKMYSWDEDIDEDQKKYVPYKVETHFKTTHNGEIIIAAELEVQIVFETVFF